MLNYDDVVLRLLSLGYELQEDDEFTLEQAMIETEQYIMNDCNLESVPEGLKYVATDICCGSFLQTKASMGELDGFDVESAVSNIQEGDVSISFNEGINQTQLFDNLINTLTKKESELVCYRKMRW